MADFVPANVLNLSLRLNFAVPGDEIRIDGLVVLIDGHLEKLVIRHSGESRNPEKSTIWTPASAGVTGFSIRPDE